MIVIYPNGCRTPEKLLVFAFICSSSSPIFKLFSFYCFSFTFSC
uniref:Uncharacterized protein n=1 Tax=Rhizophora mucronata TaxID=61149 RepID=A0A2P2NJ17_RHIMU